MHYQNLFLGALVAATTTVFTSNPFVHSFFNADCTGPDAGDKVEFFSYECAPFDSKYDAVQVNFGGDLSEILSLNVYSDPHCKNYAGKAVTSPSQYNDPTVCLSQSAHGAKWGSVMQVPP